MSVSTSTNPRLCSVCGRGYAAFFFKSPERRDSIRHSACSLDCLNLLSRMDPAIMPNHYVKTARLSSGFYGGKFLEGIGKFDLSKLTPEEYQGFVNAIFEGYEAEMKKLIGDAVPF